MPDNFSCYVAFRGRIPRKSYGKIGDALGVKMNFRIMLRSEAIEQFRQDSLRAMLLVHKGTDNGEAQLR